MTLIVFIWDFTKHVHEVISSLNIYIGFGSTFEPEQYTASTYQFWTQYFFYLSSVLFLCRINSWLTKYPAEKIFFSLLKKINESMRDPDLSIATISLRQHSSILFSSYRCCGCCSKPYTDFINVHSLCSTTIQNKTSISIKCFAIACY